MSPIKVLVVEDEVLIAETIKLYLEERGHIFLDNATSFEEAVEMVSRLKPDIVLLDIRLYGKKSGIDFANFISLNKPSLPYIFLTSHFDKSVLDKALATKPNGYLTKPISKETLWTTLELVSNKQSSITDQNPSIVVNDGDITHFIPENTIQYIQAEHVYIKIIVTDGELITSRSSLSQILNKLTSKSFIRCHRSFIINTNYIKSWSNTEILIADRVIPISRSKKQFVFEFLSNT